jgi:3-hydroxyisobutyrate dehydrogenase-like beta-hydroxyacid dehydrogenase
MSDKSMNAIGVVGVGHMGLAITKHLTRHGYSTFVHDLDAGRCELAAKDYHSKVTKTPAEVGSAARVVIIAVGFDDEATQVVLGPGGLIETMQPGSVIAISSTCVPEHVKWLASQVEKKGIRIADAPICRGAKAADEGTMLTLVGATEEVFSIVEPVYRTFSSQVVLLGDVGAGQFGKSMNNFLLWVNGIALIEAGRLSQAHGMDLVQLRSALLLGSGASDALQNWENVSFTWALKDMQIVSKIADAAGLSMPVAGAIKELVKDGLRIKKTNPPDWTGRLSKNVRAPTA